LFHPPKKSQSPLTGIPSAGFEKSGEDYELSYIPILQKAPADRVAVVQQIQMQDMYSARPAPLAAITEPFDVTPYSIEQTRW